MNRKEYELKNGQKIVAYVDAYDNIVLSRESFETMVNGWNKGYSKGFIDGVDDTTRKAENSKALRDKHIEDFIDFVFNEAREVTLTSDFGLRDYMYEMLGKYKEISNE